MKARLMRYMFVYFNGPRIQVVITPKPGYGFCDDDGDDGELVMMKMMMMNLRMRSNIIIRDSVLFVFGIFSGHFLHFIVTSLYNIDFTLVIKYLQFSDKH